MRFFPPFLACLALLSLNPVSCPAQDTARESGPATGSWRVETPDGPLVLLVKRDGRASYFWSENRDLTVFQGEWSQSAAGIEITWEDGGRHRLTPGPTSVGVEYTPPGDGAGYRAAAYRIPGDLLGQWAKTPGEDDEEVEEETGFFGVWRVGPEDADPVLVFVEPDRSAASNWAGSGLGERGLRGSWAKQGSELHISWDTGHYSVLREVDRGFQISRHEPGVLLDEDPGTAYPAIRVDPGSIEGEWVAAYRAERDGLPLSLAFSSRNDAISFYRGNWVIQTGEGSFETIEIGLFRNLATSANPRLGGEWVMQGQDLFMRWDNGMREILSPVAYGFLLYEYAPGRPLDGVPTRIHPAVPVDTGKLEENLAGRREVGERINALAEAAGVSGQVRSESWAGTFMRWVSPFDEDLPATYTGARLEEGYEIIARSERDPWWWPYWSERELPVDSPDSVGRDGRADTEDEPATARAPQRAVSSDWDWPF